jgi:dTDP-D-glucose 4,6-dehydratase
VRLFVHVSTDETYGDANDEFFNGDQQLKPTNPYSASKATAEMHVWAYSQPFNIPSLVQQQRIRAMSISRE